MHHNRPTQAGFILPALIVMSLILMSVGLVVMQYVASSTNSIQSAFYGNLAKEAANAGASFAYNCLRSANSISSATWSGTLTPQRGCTGGTVTGASSYVLGSSTSTVSSRYTVNSSDITTNPSGTTIKATGIVEFRYAGSSTPTRTVTKHTLVSIPFNLSGTNIPVPTGKAVTHLSSGLNFSCGVANQELYCWGGNDIGQLGLDECLVGIVCGGTFAGPQPTPQRVNGKDIANKRVDTSTVGGLGGCAVAEGRGYCWGNNSRGQIGDNSTTFLEVFNSFNPFGTDLFFLGFDDLLTGQRYRPTQIRGDLLNANVTKISFGRTVGAVPDRQSVCGLANGKIYCWGANAYGQLGQPAVSENFGGTGGNLCFPFIGCLAPPLAAPSCNGWVLYQWNAPSPFGGLIPSVNTRYLCAGPASTTPNSFGGILGGTTGNEDIKKPTVVLGFGNRNFGGDRYLEQDPSVALFAGKRAQDISVGATGACAIVNGGQTYCWGDITLGLGARNFSSGAFGLTTRNTSSQILGSISSLKASQVMLGNATGCVLAQGKVHCWGRLRGNGTDSLSSTTTLAQTPANIILDSVNMAGELSGFICATGAGNSYCWGRRVPVEGQNYLSPTTFTSGNDGLPISKITSVGAGAGVDPTEGLLTGFFGNPGHTCFVANATAYCAGENRYGQLGRGNTSTAASPYIFARTTNNIGLTAGEAATHIATGNNFSCAVVNTQPFCWGLNSRGQLGQANLVNQNRPTSVLGISNEYTTKISAGDAHACSVTNGKIYCWGDNTSGQQSSGAANPQTTPRLISEGGLSGTTMAASEVSAGANHTCAVINSEAWCWGANGNGQLGRGNTSSTGATTPQRVDGLLSGKLVTKITAGRDFTCAVADGQPFCWGLNSNGQLGDTTAIQRTSPVAVVNMPGTTTDIQAGASSTCAIEGGYVKCWGLNSNGQLGRGNTTVNTTMYTPQVVNTINSQNTTILSVGATHACSISNGRNYCWGSQAEGKIGNNTTSGAATSAAAVTEANAALSLGEQNKPFALSAGTNHSCAVANAKIFCWGRGAEGQLGTVGLAQQNTPAITDSYSRNAVQIAWSDTVFY